MYHLFIVTPEKIVFDDFVNSLIAPGTLGYLEILTDHAPIITSLTTGKLIITDKEQKKWFWAISEGFLEMSKNKATVLAEAVEMASEIDIKRAETALKKARKRLAAKDKEIDVERSRKSLHRAENRMRLARESKQTTKR